MYDREEYENNIQFIDNLKNKIKQNFNKSCEAWFNRYKDQEENEEIITPEGCQNFFNDLDISLDSVRNTIIFCIYYQIKQ